MAEPTKSDLSAAPQSVPAPAVNGSATMADHSSAAPAAASEANESGRNQNRDHKSNNRQRGGGRGGGGSGRGGRDGHKGRRGGHGGFGSKNRDRDWHDSKRAPRRERMNENAAEGSNMNIRFSAEEIAAETRRPKAKVAVLIGYAGTGYKGMQINHQEKTIEGDLFAAFVAAGAIQKMNADDPKKSSFVRCARTDKGVHAAGNVISLKLTVDEPDVVSKINAQLPDQIRVWGIQRTNNGFNCYQACDSRWYEYLLPSYMLLPPHPQTYLGKKVVESAKEKGVYDDCLKAWDDVKDFWEDVEKNEIQPILDRLDEKSREQVLKVIHASTDAQNETAEETEAAPTKRKAETSEVEDEHMAKKAKAEDNKAPVEDVDIPDAVHDDTNKTEEETSTAAASTEAAEETSAPPKFKYQPTAAEVAIKDIKAAYIAAKRRYRATPARIQQLQAALNMYVGTNNFHNYTIQKKFKDPSAKRHIRSFVANPTPIQIGDTEWLSLKVHGQSFMMHQIRKMVAMAVLCVRCAVPLERIKQSYGPTRISIPKAPGLGLLLERPVFESYSKKAQESLQREPLNFDKYEKEIDEFKHRQIYSRIFETEEKEASFHVFLHQLDSFETNYFLWVTAHGFEAAYEPKERYDPKNKPPPLASAADENNNAAAATAAQSDKTMEELIGNDDDEAAVSDGNGDEG